MKRVVSIAVWAASSALGSIWADSPEAVVLPDERERWTIVETPRFTVLSQTADVTTRRIAVRLEASRAAIRALSEGKLLEPATSTRVYAFRSGLGFRRYGGEKAREEGTVGLFLDDGIRGNALVFVDTPSDPFSTVHHEDLHAVTMRNFARAPLWFHEGIAEFYSTFRTEGSMAQVGVPPADTLDWLREFGLLDLESVFAATRADFDEHDAERNLGFYATSWAVVHYLLKGDDSRRAGLVRFLELSASRPAEQAFREAFGSEPSVLEKEIAAYVKNGEFRFTEIPLQGLALPEIPEPRVLSRLETLLYLGDSALSVARDPALAEAHFEAARALAAESPGWKVGMARTRALQRRIEEAIALFDEALAERPLDSAAYCFAGIVGLAASADALREAGKRPAEPPPRMRIARERLLGCLATYPDLVDANLAYGATFAWETGSNYTSGLAALEKAHSMAPDRQEILFMLMSVATLADELERAESAIELAESRFGESEATRMGRAAVASGWYRRANRLYDSRDHAGALDLLHRGREYTPDVEQRATFDEAIRALSNDMADQEAAREAERLDGILALVRKGQNRQAIPRLREFLKDCTAEEVCDLAKDTLVELERLERSNSVPR